MATTVDHLADPELLATDWDLEPLVDHEGRLGVEHLLSEASRLATAFRERYAGQVAKLDARGLAEAMHELERIQDLSGRAGSYAGLDFSTNTADPPRGALLQQAEERGTELETTLLFFELEWAALDDEHAESLLPAPELDFCRHFLRSARRYRPHLLSEPEEKVLAEKSISSQSAWGRLFGELTASLRVELDGDEVPLEVALSRLQAPDRGYAGGLPKLSPRRSSRGCGRARSSTTRWSTTRRSRIVCAPTRTGWPAGTSKTRPRTSPSPP